MQDFAGFQPQLGEIRALRTFRIGPGGDLFPLFGDLPWSGVVNTAGCALPLPGGPPAPHVAPDPDCSCGFYAYGTETAASDYPHSEHVLAVVSCWGKVIAGTRGIRAQHAVVEAIWLSDQVPPHLARRVARNYRHAIMYTGKTVMLNRHRPTAIACYQAQPAPLARWKVSGSRLATGAALLLSVLRPDSGYTAGVISIAAAQAGLFLIAATITRRKPGRSGAARRRVLILAATLWSAAPIVGLTGSLLLRIPMIAVAALIALQRRFQRKEASRFPARIAQHSRAPDRTR